MFVKHLSDHPPLHMYIYRDRRLVLKWAIREERPIWGPEPGRRLRRLIQEVLSENPGWTEE